jgi:hypothetical protein
VQPRVIAEPPEPDVVVLVVFPKRPDWMDWHDPAGFSSPAKNAKTAKKKSLSYSEPRALESSRK